MTDFQMLLRSGGTAYPVVGTSHDGDVVYYEGMTLRDWFAGQAMTCTFNFVGMDEYFDKDHGLRDSAIMAYKFADAMLKARKPSHDAT